MSPHKPPPSPSPWPYTPPPVDACSRFATNPCRQGDCVNDGEGSYLCSCPKGMREGERPDGSRVCIIGECFYRDVEGDERGGAV